VRLAFFDEPTTNMDAARRERLAEQISRITEKQTFDQLFVISHDDTFEGYADNVVSIGANL
jgi:exonuclease SbcC